MPLDLLKIDRSFISGLPAEAASVALTTSIIGLAAAFGLVTVAEGVETSEQLDKLREGMHWAAGQLYGFSFTPVTGATLPIREEGGPVASAKGQRR